MTSPIVPKRLRLPPIEQRIFNAVKERPGITAEELRAVVPGESRHMIFVRISRLNSALAVDHLMMRSEGGGYQIRTVS
jgi:hypothetical protein